MPENLISQILREKREGQGQAKVESDTFNHKVVSANPQSREITVTVEDTNLRYHDSGTGEDTLLPGHITKTNEHTTIDFEWLRSKLGIPFDLYGFEERAREMFWSGDLRGVPVRIVLKAPAAYSHCHWHMFI